VLVASGVDEENTSKPIFDALPPGNKQYYLAVRGRHGSSILPDDPANWSGIAPFLIVLPEKNKQTDKRIMGSIPPRALSFPNFLRTTWALPAEWMDTRICSDLPPYSKLLDSFQYRGISCWW
jgi:hypothetical protein